MRATMIMNLNQLFAVGRDNYTFSNTKLYDNETFYTAFVRDIGHAYHSVYIESPFITTTRMDMLLPILRRACQRGIQITVNTRPPSEHDGKYIDQAYKAVQDMQSIGMTVLYTVKHHRKIAIIDDETLWEGSLNILSQSDSCELMRRSVSSSLVRQMKKYIKSSN